MSISELLGRCDVDKHAVVDLAGAPLSPYLLAWTHGDRRDAIGCLDLSPGEYTTGDLRRISPEGLDTLGFPSLCSDGAISLALGTALADGRHRIWSCALSDRPNFVVLEDSDGAVDPVGCPAGPGAFHVAWTRVSGERSELVLARWDPAGGLKVERVYASDAVDYFRPKLQARPDGAGWLVCDGYDRLRGYAIWGLRLGDGEAGEMEVLRESEDWLRWPQVLVGEGVDHLAYMRQVDVATAHGVVDQHCTVRVCARAGDGWTGDEQVVDLAHGLLPVLLPTPMPSWGFKGRRRRPFLMRMPNGRPGVFWERKGNPDAKTGDPAASGQLCGRRLDETGWSRPFEVHRGHVLYTPCRVSDGRMVWAASTMHRADGLAVIECTDLEPRPDSQLASSVAAGWSPYRKAMAYNPTYDARPTWQLGGRCWQLYWLDLHVHGNMNSSNEGDRDELVHYARTKGELDGVCLQDNDGSHRDLSNGELSRSDLWAEWGNRDGDFAVFPGWEWTAGSENRMPDHRSVIFCRPPSAIVRFTEVESDTRKLAALAREHGAILHAHHREWSLVDGEVEANVEVASCWGRHMQRPFHVHEALARGRKFGFAGGSDDHRAVPGLAGAVTGVWAEELTPESIFEALRAHRTFMTAGGRAIAKSWIGDEPMGAAASGSDNPTVNLAFSAKVPVESVSLVRDGEAIEHWDDLHDTTYFPVIENLSVSDEISDGREHYYYWEIKLAVPEFSYPGNTCQSLRKGIWTSPVWYRRI